MPTGFAMSEEHSKDFRPHGERWKRMKSKKKPKAPDSPQKLDETQVLIPQTSFDSPSNLTSWIISGQQKSKTKVLTPHLQIWRESSSYSGTYQLISSTAVDVGHLTVIPEFDDAYAQTPSSPVIVEPGDFVGVYQPPMSESQFIMYVRVGEAAEEALIRSEVHKAPNVGDLFINDSDVISVSDLVLVTYKAGKFGQHFPLYVHLVHILLVFAEPLGPTTLQLSSPSATVSSTYIGTTLHTTSHQTLSSKPYPYSSSVVNTQSEIAMGLTKSSQTHIAVTKSWQTLSSLPNPYSSAVVTDQSKVGVPLTINSPATPTPVFVSTPVQSSMPTVSGDRFMNPDFTEKTVTSEQRYQSISADGIQVGLVQAVYESQLEGSGDQSNGQDGVDLVIVIVIGALLGVTSITTVIAIVAFSVVVALIRKKSSNQIIQGTEREFGFTSVFDQ